MFGFKKKKTSTFYGENVSLGRTQGKWLKPTKKELNEMKGGERIKDTPHNYSKERLGVRINKKIDRFNQGLNDFDSIMDNIGKGMGGGSKKKSDANFGARNIDLPGALKDPWGKYKI